jgi:small subunit ribosomal protein S8
MDPITDMFNIIKNALTVNKSTVDIPFSQIKHEIAKILSKEGFIGKVETKGRKIKKVIRINLKYIDDTPAILNLKRVSKPGQRIYLSYDKIKRVRAGYGITILSTPEGLMTGKEARKKRVGGEVICKVW